MKRILSALLALSLLLCTLSLFGCAKDNTVPLADYAIVIPAEADLSTEYSAQILASELLEKTGVSLEIITDAEPERAREILIGETSRDESAVELSLSDGQYCIYTRGEKIALKGYGIYIGSACYALLSTQGALCGDGIDLTKLPSEPSASTYAPQEAYSSVIFMIGDGMGDTHIRMTEEKAGAQFIAKSFPNKATSVTRSLSVIREEVKFTDSAAAATAMATGYKTLNEYIGVDKDLLPVKNVRELAFESGAKTAVILPTNLNRKRPYNMLYADCSLFKGRRKRDDDLINLYEYKKLPLV